MKKVLLAMRRKQVSVLGYLPMLFLFLFMPACFASFLPAGKVGQASSPDIMTSGDACPTREEIIQKTQKLQMPFIANDGQTDERVNFYANTFGGTVFVTKEGEIVYALPKSGDVEDGETHRKAAKCAKERSEKHISHKDTKNTEEMIEGGMDSWRVHSCNLNPGIYLDNGALFNQWRNQPYNLSSTQIGETWGSNCKFEPAMKIKPC